MCAKLDISSRENMIDPSYRSIGVASTFSPRFREVLAEAKRVRDRFGSTLALIYVGERTAETAAKFGEVLASLELPADSVVHYETGDPATAILQLALSNQMDLIVAGALEKEAVLRPFLGNVARRLAREAHCSVMLFTKPESAPKPFRRIVFIADYAEQPQDALSKTLQLAAHEKSERLYVIRIHTTFDEARASLRTDGDESGVRTLEEEEAALEDLIQAAGPTEVPIEARCIRGNTGFAASDFVQSVEADLLVVPISRTEANEMPAQIAWITEVIPCNLWIIR